MDLESLVWPTLTGWYLLLRVVGDHPKFSQAAQRFEWLRSPAAPSPIACRCRTYGWLGSASGPGALYFERTWHSRYVSNCLPKAFNVYIPSWIKALRRIAHEEVWGIDNLAWAVPIVFSFSFQKDVVNPHLLKYDKPMELHAKSELLRICQGVRCQSRTSAALSNLRPHTAINWGSIEIAQEFCAIVGKVSLGQLEIMDAGSVWHQ